MTITQNELVQLLRSRSDEKFRIFNEKIIHTSKLKVIGVKMPDIKALAAKHSDSYKEIFELPYDSFEELMFKGAALGLAKAPLSEKEPYIYRYGEMIDNWAECDCFCTALKPAKGEREKLREIIDDMLFSDKEFVSRIGIVLLFSKFHDEQSADYALGVYEKLPCGAYYRDMAVAWGISVYCVYFPEKTAEYLRSSPIAIDIKRKAAQKIRDSRRISDEIKKRITDAVNKEYERSADK